MGRTLAACSALIVGVTVAGAAAAGCSMGDPANPPDGSEHVGPAPLRRLSNEEYANALRDLFPGVNATLPALPADVAVAGFDNAAAAQEPSDVRIARYQEIADVYAAALTADTRAALTVSECADASTKESASACAEHFVDRVASRIFRRPVTAAERDRALTHFREWQTAVDFDAAVRLSLSAWLQAPQFLYRVETPAYGVTPGSVIAVEPYGMASRLSFFLWASVPDDTLLDAASRNGLRSADQVRVQATRMLNDARAVRVLFGFHRQWLGLDRIELEEHAARTPQVDLAWTPATQTAAFTESEVFIANTLARGGTFRDLLTSREAWVNADLARIYGVSPPSDPNAWAEVTLPEGERAGLLTRVDFLAGYSHRGATSPPVRGNGIQLRLLCQLPVSPPPGADLSQPKVAPGQGPQTNRMLFEARTSPPQCQMCHQGLNGFGFGLESYDAAGHYRTTDDGLPVDASGTIHGTDVDGPYRGGVELSVALSQSEVVHRCATQQMVRYALGRAPAQMEQATLASMTERFFDSGGDEKQLLMDIVTSPTFRLRIAGSEEATQ